MRRIFTLLMVILFSVGFVNAQVVSNVTKVGTVAGTFLEIPIGARAMALGGAYAGISDEVTSLYWNPGGAAVMQNMGLYFEHTNWLADTKFDYAGIVFPIEGFGTIGASFTALTMGEMEVTTVDQPNGTGEKFSSTDICAAVTYAIALTDRFHIGFNGKYVNERIWHMTAQTMAIDVGTLFITPFFGKEGQGLRIGMSISNFGPSMQLRGRDTAILHDIAPQKYGNNPDIQGHLDTDKWSLPLVFRAGVALDVVKTSANRVLVAVDVLHPNNNAESMNLGAEYSFSEKVFLRAGYKSLFLVDNEGGLSFGGGITSKLIGMGDTIKLDYAYQDYGRLNNTQKLSIQLAF